VGENVRGDEKAREDRCIWNAPRTLLPWSTGRAIGKRDLAGARDLAVSELSFIPAITPE